MRLIVSLIFVGALGLSLAAGQMPTIWNPAADFHPDPAARLPTDEAVDFVVAKAVWPAGCGGETNSFFGFRADFDAKPGMAPVLRIAAATVYRVFVNGNFVGYGPVRAPHGYSRADEWPLGAVVKPGANALAVEVSNYNLPVFSCDGTRDGFLLAEVAVDKLVLCATGRDFSFFELPRVRNTSRLTPQRALVEMYRLAPGWDSWRTARGLAGEAPTVVDSPRLLPRITPYPWFDVVRPQTFGRTEFAFDEQTPPSHPELAYDGHDELARLRDMRMTATDVAAAAISPGRGFVADFGRVDAGFPGFEITCDGPCRIYAVWDEVLTHGIPDPLRRWGHAMSAVWDFSAAGTYRVETVEPTAVRYIHLFARQGQATVGGIYLREYKNPLVYAARFACSDDRLNRVFAAARDTCAQCTMDATLDNPDRERNSGPCDAFFTLGGYAWLSGDYRLERLMFENYAIPERYPNADGAMLPWCYPADFGAAHQAVIPQYASWFLIQLERYTADSGDTSIRDRLSERLLKLPEAFRRYYNSDGLVEGMPWWDFLGWSMVSAFTKDVNYPSNALWSEGLDVLARLYNRPDLHVEAERIRAVVRKQSFDGTWFRDHARRRKDGVLSVGGELSETCQYYMFAFGVATPTRDADCWNRLVASLGRYAPGYGKALGPMYPANYFEGLVLRHEVLTNNGLDRDAVRELGFLVDMADRTGTLWEGYPGICNGFMPNGCYSCCQGFTSYAARQIYKSALGIRRIDPVRKGVSFAVPDNGLKYCRGTLPTADGPIACSWERGNGTVSERLSLPTGWTRLKK